MMTVDEQCEMLRAEAAGKVVQYKPYCDNGFSWESKGHPGTWKFETCQYRVKPEPREFWLSRKHFGENVGGWCADNHNGGLANRIATLMGGFDQTSELWIEVLRVREIL